MYRDNMKDAPDISVVVPVYNTSPYLHRCLDSIIGQSIKGFEIILVNDGSTDDSEAICREYADSFGFITLISKENGGLSDARNTGVANANGKYITFIDSDDYVDRKYLETLYSPILNGSADISAVGLSVFSDRVLPPVPADTVNFRIMTGKEALLNVMYQQLLDTSACALLIPISLALRHPFPVGKYHEDEFTTYKYYKDCERVAVASEKLYFYYQREGSIMHSLGQAKYDELDAADNLIHVFSDDTELKKAAEAKCFSDYCQVLISAPEIKTEDRETYKRILNYLKKTRIQMIFDKRTRLKNKLAAASLLFGPIGLKAASKLKDM